MKRESLLQREPSDKELLDRHRGCPKVRYRASWCQGLCTPSEGVGLCGRPAPHAMLGKTQRAIFLYQARKQQAALSRARRAQ